MHEATITVLVHNVASLESLLRSRSLVLMNLNPTKVILLSNE